MAPILKTAPTPTAFAKAWEKEFSSALEKAAGKDGRLSRTEARRLSERTDGAQVFSNNALKLLDTFGSQTSSISRLVAAGRAEAEAAAKAVAGSDGKVSLADGARLPQELRDDFLFLRGKGPVPQPQYTAAQLKAKVISIVTKALDDGTAVKLPSAPATVRGRNPVAEFIPHPPSNTRFAAWVANGVIYISRSAQTAGTGLVGFYKVGKLPPP
jgi:hypothetical protein